MELIVALIVILIISIALTLFRLRKYLYVKLRQYNMSKNFGGLRAYPIIGNSFVFLGDLNDSFLALDLDLQRKPGCKLHRNIEE
ncbi:hypothetical protein M0802_016607 [Mischocyttarus mexicanus]|nr:hypothetical protein M0802_016607 [Mischocyttarus mexicanus]